MSHYESKYKTNYTKRENEDENNVNLFVNQYQGSGTGNPYEKCIFYNFKSIATLVDNLLQKNKKDYKLRDEFFDEMIKAVNKIQEDNWKIFKDKFPKDAHYEFQNSKEDNIDKNLINDILKKLNDEGRIAIKPIIEKYKEKLKKNTEGSMRKLIAKLLSEGKKKEEIVKIIKSHLKNKIKANDADTNVKNLFATIAVSIKSAGEAYDVGDVAHLNFTLNTVTSIKKTISELEKILTEIKTANETPGGEPVEPIEESKKDLTLKPAEVKPEIKSEPTSEIKKSEEVK
jgi:hypothetical protein